MSESRAIADHYTSGSLLERLFAMLREDGVDVERLSVEALAPYDQFHGRGIEATAELADSLDIGSNGHILDIGAGIGGPARYMAERFGCKVTGIDLTPEFCDVARQLNEKLDLADKVTIEQGDALSMPFEDACFDGAYSMNVSMNIADKDGFYAEVFRVLKPGGWFALGEIAKGSGEPVNYPTPWAKTADSSFLSTPEDTREGLIKAGFVVTDMHDNLEAVFDYGRRSKAAVEHGGKPLHRAVSLIHGDLAEAAAANSGQAVRSGATLPIEVFCRRP